MGSLETFEVSNFWQAAKSNSISDTLCNDPIKRHRMKTLRKSQQK
jgi:hypothetical protein